MSQRAKLVTPREIWTLYVFMLLAAFLWGGLWSLLAWWAFKFNRAAFSFLAVLTVTTGLCSGLTVFAGMRRLLLRAEDRAADSDLDLPL